jgi:hypothetical protein
MLCDVRFVPKADILRRNSRCLFDHLVGEREQIRRDYEPERLSSLEKQVGLRQSFGEPSESFSFLIAACQSLAARLFLRGSVEINADVPPVLPNHVRAIGQRIRCKCPIG